MKAKKNDVKDSDAVYVNRIYFIFYGKSLKIKNQLNQISYIINLIFVSHKLSYLFLTIVFTTLTGLFANLTRVGKTYSVSRIICTYLPPKVTVNKLLILAGLLAPILHIFWYICI